MIVYVNGEKTILEKPISVKALLEIKKVDNPQYVTVAINEEFISTEDFDTVVVKENDAVEFLYFMGGGAR